MLPELQKIKSSEKKNLDEDYLVIPPKKKAILDLFKTSTFDKPLDIRSSYFCGIILPVFVGIAILFHLFALYSAKYPLLLIFEFLLILDIIHTLKYYSIQLLRIKKPDKR